MRRVILGAPDGHDPPASPALGQRRDGARPSCPGQSSRRPSRPRPTRPSCEAPSISAWSIDTGSASARRWRQRLAISLWRPSRRGVDDARGVARQAVPHRVNAPDEDAGVPPRRRRWSAKLQGLLARRLLHETVDRVRRGRPSDVARPERGPRDDVAVARLGSVHGDAEGHEGSSMPKAPGRGRSSAAGQDSRGSAPPRRCSGRPAGRPSRRRRGAGRSGRKGNGRGRVAPDGSPMRCRDSSCGACSATRPASGGSATTSVSSGRDNGELRAVDSWRPLEKLSSPISGRNGLGRSAELSGHSRVPPPPARTTACIRGRIVWPNDQKLGGVRLKTTRAAMEPRFSLRCGSRDEYVIASPASRW